MPEPAFDVVSLCNDEIGSGSVTLSGNVEGSVRLVGFCFVSDVILKIAVAYYEICIVLLCERLRVSVCVCDS